MFGLHKLPKGMPEFYNLDNHLTCLTLTKSKVKNVHLLMFDAKFLSKCLAPRRTSWFHAAIIQLSVESFLSADKMPIHGRTLSCKLLEKIYKSYPSAFGKFSSFQDMVDKIIRKPLSKDLDYHLVKTNPCAYLEKIVTINEKHHLADIVFSEEIRKTRLVSDLWRMYFRTIAPRSLYGARKDFNLNSRQRKDLKLLLSYHPKEFLRQYLKEGSHISEFHESQLGHELGINYYSIRIIEMLDRADQSNLCESRSSFITSIDSDSLKRIICTIACQNLDHALFILPAVCKEWQVIVSQSRKEILSYALTNSRRAAIHFIFNVISCSRKKLTSSYVFPWKVLSKQELIEEVTTIMQTPGLFLNMNKFKLDDRHGIKFNSASEFSLIFGEIITRHTFESFAHFEAFTNNCLPFKNGQIQISSFVARSSMSSIHHLLEYMMKRPEKIRFFCCDHESVLKLIDLGFSTGRTHQQILSLFDRLNCKNRSRLTYLAILGYNYSPTLYQFNTVKFIIDQNTRYATVELNDKQFILRNLRIYECSTIQEQSHEVLSLIVNATIDKGMRRLGDDLDTETVLRMISCLCRLKFPREIVNMFIMRFAVWFGFNEICESIIEGLYC
jgi:hypothetical protein